MKIHTVNAGETISDISKIHGVPECLIMRDNGLSSDALIVGEELVIITPTRTYVPRYNENIAGISHRFGIKESSIAASNPSLNEKNIYGEVVVLKYPDAMYGSAAANGFYYRGCSADKLREVLPYLTYLTVAAVSADDGGIHRLFDTKDVLKMIEGTGIIPLLKIFDNRKSPDYGNREKSEKFNDLIIKTAMELGFEGIVLDFSSTEFTEEVISEFSAGLRRRMIGSDLILITETDEATPPAVGDHSDGCIFSFGGNFAENMRGRLEKYAKESESARTFLDLPLFSVAGKEFLPTLDALDAARRGNAFLCRNESERTLSFTHKRRGEITMPSLNCIKGMLDLVNEYDYMGISFDIAKVPISYLTMYNSLFKTVKSTSARAAEGCSRGQRDSFVQNRS